MNVIFCLSLLIIAVMGHIDPDFVCVCDREIMEVLLKFKAECCHNMWPYQLFLAELRPHAKDIMETDLMAMGTNMFFNGLSKDAEVDNEKLQEMDEMLMCVEKQFEENQCYEMMIDTCTKRIAQSREDDGTAKQSMLVCLFGEFLGLCPEIKAELTGNYGDLADLSGFAY